LNEAFKLSVDVLVDPGRELGPEAVGNGSWEARLVLDGTPTEPRPALRQSVVDTRQRLDKRLAGVDSTPRNVMGLPSRRIGLGTPTPRLGRDGAALFVWSRGDDRHREHSGAGSRSLSRASDVPFSNGPCPSNARREQPRRANASQRSARLRCYAVREGGSPASRHRQVPGICARRWARGQGAVPR
jgi:hypothetical protein